MKASQVNMLSGSVFGGLLSLTIPIMIMNVMQNMFGVIDMTILGNFADDSAVGAVGAAGTLITLCTSLLIGISAGANVVVANHIGRGDRERAEMATGTAILFSVIGGFVMLIIGVTCAKVFLKWTDCPEILLDKSSVYFRIYFIGAPITMLYNFCAAILRATGDTKSPMYFLIIGGIAKIILNVIFIKLFNMTVDGVAIATIISNAIAGGLSLMLLIKKNELVRIRLRHLRFYGKELKRMLFIGVPTGLQSSLYSFANTIIVTTVNGFGPQATTGLSIANQFDGILYNIAHAPSLAVIPYVAQNVGAGNSLRVKEAIRKSVLITTIFGASLGMLSAIFSRQLSSIMSTTPEVIRYSQQKMIIVSSTYFICGINEVISGSLRGLGKPIIPTVNTLGYMCLLRIIWVYFIFPLCPQSLTFLYLVWPIGWSLMIATQLITLVPAIRKLKK